MAVGPEVETLASGGVRDRRPLPPWLRWSLTAVVAVLGVVLALGLAWRQQPVNHAVSQPFTVSKDTYLGEYHACVRFTASGVLMARASRDLGPLTRWDGVHIAYMHLATDVRSATGPGPCDPEASPVDASAMEMQERWDRAIAHDFLNDEGGDGSAGLDELGAGHRSAGGVNGFSHGFTDVLVPGERHGRQLCLHGNANFVMYSDSGSGSDGGGLDLKPCLTPNSSLT